MPRPLRGSACSLACAEIVTHSIKRANLTLGALQATGFLAFRDLQRLLCVSPATIRRDLIALERKGAVSRVRGGVMLAQTDRCPTTSWPPPGREGLNSSRPISNLAAKKAIARAAIELVHPCEELLVGDGTTTIELCHLLAGLNCTVLTNSLAIMDCLLPQSDTRVIVSSGWVMGTENVIVPMHPDEPMPGIRAKKLFMSPEAISAQGILQSDDRLAAAQRDLIARAEAVIVLADSSKFARRSGAIVCSLDRVQTLITDNVPADMERVLTQAGVKALLAA